MSTWIVDDCLHIQKTSYRYFQRASFGAEGDERENVLLVITFRENVIFQYEVPHIAASRLTSGD